MLQLVKFLLVAVKTPVLTDGRPQHLTDPGDDGKLNAVTVHTLVFGKRVRLVTQVDHDDVVVEMDVDVLLRQSEIGLTTLHIAHDAGTVGIAGHQDASCLHQQVEFTAQQLHPLALILSVVATVAGITLFLQQDLLQLLCVLEIFVRIVHCYNV